MKYNLEQIVVWAQRAPKHRQTAPGEQLSMSTVHTLAQVEANPLLAFPPEAWKTTRPGERLARHKQWLIEMDCQRQVDIERARYTTQSYQRSEGLPMPVRRARMLLDLVRHMSITIYPHELIVGNRSLLRHLVVRVAGYSAYFTELDRELQDEIIRRTEFAAV